MAYTKIFSALRVKGFTKSRVLWGLAEQWFTLTFCISDSGVATGDQHHSVISRVHT